MDSPDEARQKIPRTFDVTRRAACKGNEHTNIITNEDGSRFCRPRRPCALGDDCSALHGWSAADHTAEARHFRLTSGRDQAPANARGCRTCAEPACRARSTMADRDAATDRSSQISRPDFRAMGRNRGATSSIRRGRAHLIALARTWEGEPHGEPWRNPARTEPRPPGITQSRLAVPRLCATAKSSSDVQH
jgi:hypothetical protein